MSERSPKTNTGGREGVPPSTGYPPPADSEEALANVTAMFLPPQEAGKEKARLLPVAVYPMGMSRIGLRRFFWVTLFGILAAYFLLQVQSIVPPFLISFFLAALFDPIIRKLGQKTGRPRWYNIGLIYLMTIAVIVLIIIAIVPNAMLQFQEFSLNFSTYYTKIQNNADKFIHDNSATLKRLNLKENSLSDFLSSQSSPLKNGLDSFLISLTGLTRSLFAHAIWFIIIPIATFVLMLDYPYLRARIISFFPEDYQDDMDTVSNEIMEVFSGYLRGLMKVCALFGLTAYIVYTLFGVQYSLVLGLLAGLFYAIPYVGPLATSILIGSVAFSMEAHTSLLFWHVPANSLPFTLVCIVLIILQGFVFDNLVYPRVVGGSVGLHPVVSMFAMTAGATLLGLPGMLIAVPVAASIQVIVKAMFPRMKESLPPRVSQDSEVISS